MSLALTYRLKLLSNASTPDMTSRLAGFTVSQPVSISRTSPHSGLFTLHNYDGALTPDAGGTYSNLDWFEYAVQLDVSVNGGSYVPVFHGIIDDFQLVDDGVSSTVTLRALDWLTMLGRAQGSYTVNLDIGNGIKQAVTSLTAVIPDLGTGAPVSIAGTPISASTINVTGSFSGYVGDSLNGNIMGAAHCAAWAGDMTVGGYTINIHGDTLTNTAATPITMIEDSAASGEITFQALTVGYNVSELVNYTSVTRPSSTAQTSTDATSVAKYGERSYTAIDAALATDTDALTAAQQRTNRQSTARFAPRTVTLSEASLAADPSGSATNLETILWSRYVAFYPLVIKHTPTGAASQQTYNVVTAGRRISGTPSNSVWTFDLLPAVDYQSFVLDSDVLGVLDENRLG